MKCLLSIPQYLLVSYSHHCVYGADALREVAVLKYRDRMRGVFCRGKGLLFVMMDTVEIKALEYYWP